MLTVLIHNADGTTDQRDRPMTAPIHASHETVMNGDDSITAIEVLGCTFDAV